MTGRAAWVGAAVLAIASCAVTALTPHAHLTYSTAAVDLPFSVALTQGETRTGRTLVATPEGVRGARAIHDGVDEFAGTWLIVDLELDATGVEPSTSLDLTQLEIGGVVYTPSARLDGTLLDARLRAGLPVAGSLVFELPPEAVRGSARLTLASTVRPRLDDQLVLDIDLDDVPIANAVEVAPWRWV